MTELGTDGCVPNTGTGAINESRVTLSDFQLVDNLLRQVVIGQDAQGNDIFYNPGRFQGFNFDQESTKGIIKLDWNINDNNRLAVIYNFLDASKGKPANRDAITFRGPNLQTLQFENAGYEINNKINSLQLELNTRLSDEATNKLGQLLLIREQHHGSLPKIIKCRLQRLHELNAICLQPLL